MATIAGDVFLQVLDAGERVFVHPVADYSWREIITMAVAGNTFRGFHRRDKSLPGAERAFREYFNEQEASVVRRLSNIENRGDLHALCNAICNEIRSRRELNVVAEMLSSYNKIRKPVDLYIEHIVAMASEMDGRRATIVPCLFLPLDSQIISHPGLLTDGQLTENGLNRKSTFSAVKTQSAYWNVQDAIKRRAEDMTHKCGRPFHPIYFDLFWGDRYKRSGCNLLEMNPAGNVPPQRGGGL